MYEYLEELLSRKTIVLIELVIYKKTQVIQIYIFGSRAGKINQVLLTRYGDVLIQGPKTHM
jgi:hypothetical protein